MFKCIIIGRIGRDPESKTTATTTITRLSVATDSGYGDKKKTTWTDCTAFGKTAEAIAKHFKKGDKIALDGRVEIQEWEKDGEKKSKHACIIDGWEFVGGKSDAEQAAPVKSEARPVTRIPTAEGYEDVPF